jgi:hypothetical protein
MLASVVNSFWRRVDSTHAHGIVREFRGAVARTAANIEHATASRKTAGEGVSRNMFRPEFVIHLAGDDAFAGEFGHSAAAPKLVMTRAGRLVV